MKSGDTALFRCGDTFFGALRPPCGKSFEKKTTLSFYGKGKNPVISQYKKAKHTAWEKYSEGVFRLDLSDSSNFSGNVFDLDTSVGFIKASGKIYYRNRKSCDELLENWDFFCDGKYVYVFLPENPTEFSQDILFACNIRMIRPADHLVIKGLSFVGTGGHGFQGVTHDCVISDCSFCELGGSFMLDEHGVPTKIRYGNGVECWTGSRDVLVENCFFRDIYDVAMSIQGWRAVTNWENIVFRHNTVKNCTQSFEIWTKPEKEHTGIVNCFFEYNTCIDSGYGWGFAARPDKAQACHLLIYHRECEFCDIHIRNNTFINAAGCVIFKSGGVGEIPHDYKVYGNRIIHDAKKPIVFRWEDTDENDYIEYENELLKNNEFYDIKDFDSEKEKLS